MPIQSKNKSWNGTSGVAEVRVLADYLKVIFTKDGDQYVVNKEGFDREPGVYRVTLTKTNDKIKSLAPVGRDDPYMVVFDGYFNRVGRSENNPGVPEPSIKPASIGYKEGKPFPIPERLVATALFRVVEKGQYHGLTIFYDVPYIFSQVPGTMSTMLEGTRGERERTENFLRMTGFDLLNDDIPWSGNVLPTIEPRQLASRKVLSLRLNEKGYPAKDGLTAIPSYMIPLDLVDLGDNKNGKKPAAKKAAKKPAAKKPVAKKSAAKRVAKTRK